METNRPVKNKALLSNNINEIPSQAKVSTQTVSNKYKIITKNEARVTVEVLPKQLGVEEEENIFMVSPNTHSVELDFDFTKIIILKE